MLLFFLSLFLMRRSETVSSFIICHLRDLPLFGLDFITWHRVIVSSVIYTVTGINIYNNVFNYNTMFRNDVNPFVSVYNIQMTSWYWYLFFFLLFFCFSIFLRFFYFSVFLFFYVFLCFSMFFLSTTFIIRW